MKDNGTPHGLSSRLLTWSILCFVFLMGQFKQWKLPLFIIMADNCTEGNLMRGGVACTRGDHISNIYRAVESSDNENTPRLKNVTWQISININREPRSMWSGDMEIGDIFPVYRSRGALSSGLCVPSPLRLSPLQFWINRLCTEVWI